MKMNLNGEVRLPPHPGAAVNTINNSARKQIASNGERNETGDTVNTGGFFTGKGRGGWDVNQSVVLPAEYDGKHVERRSHQRLVTVRTATGVLPPGDRRRPAEN